MKVKEVQTLFAIAEGLADISTALAEVTAGRHVQTPRTSKRTGRVRRPTKRVQRTSKHVQALVKRAARVKAKPKGSEVKCPVCREHFVKSTSANTFCSNFYNWGDGNCKDEYWLAVLGSENER